ncbi:P-loop containing nucleoside triphosphate hydrolase [Sesbania bispinosa]|nr:P-loop containing nucleoside triphosphate hydrolase [Sesbania bispinosa]
MSNITVCARFRPLTSKEKQICDDSVCIRYTDAETFIFKDDKDEEFVFSFDRVFYEKSEQADIYQFLALPIVRDAVNAINGTIITYGQTGAGKTYSMEGPSILECDEQKKGLLPRVVEGLFDSLNPSDEDMTYSIKLSMVEIYMEKVRDLFDLSKDNIQIKESKSRGIYLPAVTEITVLDPAEALQSLSRGIANRAVGETLVVGRSLAFSNHPKHKTYRNERGQQQKSLMRSGKLILVDLAGSEKVEKTGAEGRVLEEAKTINKSLSALGNVINSLTCGLQGKASHIPYRDSKLTRILQDALGGNARTALLCCCSPSAFNASESLSTLRFGARAKHIKASPRVNCSDEKCDTASIASSPPGDESSTRILNQLRERLNVEDVKLLEELFTQEGILFDPPSVEEESEIEDLTLQTISSLQEALEKLISTVDEANSAEFNYPAIFNFGDSNSDTGDLVAGLGIQLALPYGQDYFKTPSGRFCDGRLIVDFLSNS